MGLGVVWKHGEDEDSVVKLFRRKFSSWKGRMRMQDRRGGEQQAVSPLTEMRCVSNYAGGPGWRRLVSFLCLFFRSYFHTLHRAGASVTPKKSVKNARWHCRLGTRPIILESERYVFSVPCTEELRAIMTSTSFQLKLKSCIWPL